MHKKLSNFLKKHVWHIQFLLAAVFFVALILPSSAVLASSPSEPPYENQLRGCFEDGRLSVVIATEQTWSNYPSSQFRSWAEANAFAESCRRPICGSGNQPCCNTFCAMAGRINNANCVSSCLSVR